MRIYKTIHGEKTPYKIKFILNEMKVEVRYFVSDESVIGTITDDFKYIILPDDYLSPYISGVGRVKVGKLKLDKRMQQEAKEYNQNK